ncbi:MAG: GNAT family N-acetyltransferase [Actinomycetota bacterium]
MSPRTPNPDVRTATAADAGHIKRLALDNNMFQPDEMGDFDEMLAGFFDGSLDNHHWLVATASEVVVAAAYYAPEPFADRMWNLYFIATAPDQHGSGAGTALIDAVETDLSDRGPDVARTLIVDTSSVDDYESARAFYHRRGFVEEARVRDFYGPGDDKVTFWKRLGT